MSSPLPNAPLDSVSREMRWLVWLTGFAGFLNIYGIQSVVGKIVADFRLAPAEAGMAVGVTVLAVALMSPVMGVISDRVGRTPLIRATLFLLTGVTALIPLSESFSALLTLRFLQGVFLPGVSVAIAAYLSEEYTPRCVPVLGAAYVGGTVMGGFAGRFVTGHMSESPGWRGAFAVLAVLTLIGAAVVAIRLPGSRRFVSERSLTRSLGIMREHLANPELRRLYYVGFSLLFALIAVFTYANLHLAAAPFRLGSGALANLFCVYLFGGLLTPLSSRLTASLGFARNALGALALTGVGLLLLLVPNLVSVVVGLVIFSCGIFLCQSAVYARVASRVERGRSLATGLYNATYYAGGAAGALIGGFAYQAFGWGGCVASVGALLAVAAAWVR